MEPISDFLRQLFPTIPKERISTLSCKHVIPKKNLLTQVVSSGPRKVDFEFKFANRGDEAIVSFSATLCQYVRGVSELMTVDRTWGGALVGSRPGPRWDGRLLAFICVSGQSQDVLGQVGAAQETGRQEAGM